MPVNDYFCIRFKAKKAKIIDHNIEKLNDARY